MKASHGLTVFAAGLLLSTGISYGQTAINQAAVLAGGITIGDGAGFPATLSGSNSSFILTSNIDVGAAMTVVNGFNITGSDITLDLNGFMVSDKNTCAGFGSPGNSCVGGSTNAEILINITGDRVTIKNGSVKGSKGKGIYASGSNVVIDRVAVSQSAGMGIECGSGGACPTIVNSSSTLNGSYGLSAFGLFGGASVVNSTFGNNGYGAAITLGFVDGAIAQANTNFGINSDHSTIVHANASWNGGVGFFGSGGVIRDSVANQNGSDGFLFSGGAMLIDDSSQHNAGTGINLTASDCYSNVAASLNTTAQITGGIALTGTHVTCP